MRCSVHALFVSVFGFVAAGAGLLVPSAWAGSIYDDYRTLAPAAGVAVQDKTASIGHLSLTFTSGTIYPLKTAGGDVAGFYFQGAGKYAYRTEDPQDIQTFANNLHAASRVLAGTDSTVYDNFKSMALLFGRPMLEDLWSGAPAGGATTGDATQGWSKYARQMDLSDIGFDHQALEARFNGGEGQIVYAEFEGERERAGYSLDHVRYGGEAFFLFVHYPGIDFRFFKRVSYQKPKQERTRAAEIVLDKADFDIDTPDNRAGSITSTLSFRLERAGLRVLSFSLTNNRDPGSFRWDSDKNALHVKRVVDGTGKELAFSHRYNELSVDLGEAKPADTRLDLKFETQGEIFTEPDGRRDNQYVTLYGINWYPSPQQVAQERFTFHMRVRCKKPYIPVASGDRVSLTEDGNFEVLESASSIPVDDVAVYMGKYTPREVQRATHVVRLYSYGVTREENAVKLVNLAADVLDYLEKRLGPYPFKELELIELPSFAQFGISPVGIALLTSGDYKTEDEKIRGFIGSHGVNALVAHEIAHQWFGHQVIPRSGYDWWLAEAFAEYWSGLVMGSPADPRIKGFPQLLSEWRGYSKFADTAGSIEGANLVAGDLGFEYRFYLLYYRGALVLHMLRSLVGDERFAAVNRAFIAAGKQDSLTTDDFANVVSKTLNLDMHWYFDQWIRQPGTPTIKIDKQVVAEAGGFALVGKVQQSPEGFKKIHIPFVLKMPGDRVEVKLLFQEKPVQEFHFPLSAQPTSVQVDPAQNNLAYYK